MDDEDELARTLAEFGIQLPEVESDGPDDAVAPRWGETDELGEWE